jgi:hypothetical protein
MMEKFPIHNPAGDGGFDRSRRDFIKKVVFAAGGVALSSCGLNGENEPDKKNVKAKQPLPADNHELSEEERKLEQLMQRSFYEDYAKDYAILYGSKLYANSELFDQNFKFVPDARACEVRLLQFFLRNGREKTFESADRLGCRYHRTLLTEEHVMTRLFADAGIDIQGEEIEWVEVPGGRSGSVSREGTRYGGNDEIVMSVEGFTPVLDDWVQEPSRKAGYDVDPLAEFEGTVVNEMSHEIQHKFFHELFSKGDWKRLDEPFSSFVSEIPELKFRNNAQAAEFLSDVADWSSGGKYFCFFNSLGYMSEAKSFGHSKDDRYWYSYRVQQYAMEQVLRNKGVSDPKSVVRRLLEEADNSNYKNHGELFVSARKYFKEEEFSEIAKIYRRIGVELLKKMKPYFAKSNKR